MLFLIICEIITFTRISVLYFYVKKKNKIICYWREIDISFAIADPQIDQQIKPRSSLPAAVFVFHRGQRVSIKRQITTCIRRLGKILKMQNARRSCESPREEENEDSYRETLEAVVAPAGSTGSQ